MRFADIESLLGHDTVARVQQAIISAYEASDGDDDAVRALRELLIGMLATIVTTKRSLPRSQQLAAEDAAQLQALVARIREIAPQPAAVVTASGVAVATLLRMPVKA